MYSKEGIGTARSLNIEDIEKHFTQAGKDVRDNYDEGTQYGTTKTYTENTYYPSI